MDEQNQNEASNSNEIIEQLKQSEKNLLESQKKLVSFLKPNKPHFFQSFELIIKFVFFKKNKRSKKLLS